MPDPVNLTVTITGPYTSPTYSGNADAATGDITAHPGTSRITFNAGSNLQFKSPWISLVTVTAGEPPPGNTFTVNTNPAPSASSFTVRDVDPTGHPGTNYEYKYTIHCVGGDIDPRIINSGT